MKSLYLTIAFSLALLALLPFKDCFACGFHTPLYTHFVYLFAHASILHWACNAWSLLVLHNLFTPSRLLGAYVLSVGVSFLPLNSAHPVLGISVVVCFFIGLMARRLYCQSRLSFFLTLAVLLLSCLLPGFAGIYHVVMFILGAAYFHMECFVKRINAYVNGK